MAPTSNPKLISLEAAAEMVPSGCSLALGGMTLYRRPVAFVRALIRRYRRTGEPCDLTLMAFTGGFENDLLVGCGMVSKVRTCYFGLEIFGLAPMFTYCAGKGAIEVVDETEASIAFGLRARIAGVGFMAARGWLGTDMLALRPDVRTVIDPYTGEELVAFPAIKPDVAVIHALQVDPDGNAVIGENKAFDEELTLTAGKVILTAEELVPELRRVNLIGPLTTAFALAENGARPTSCHPRYPMDGEALLEYSEQVSDPDSLEKYLDRWLQ